MITGDVSPTAGRAFVAGEDVTGQERDGVAAARRHLGYCSQLNPLLDLMTGRETLTMFGKLRGIPSDRIDCEVSMLLDRLGLTPHSDKKAETYSGGNKRKLSLGVSLIGEPDVLLIDEASSGLDPASKRRMWNLISEVAQNRSVILTTHSMAEAEALSSRVGIMKNGSLMCLGSVQHLKVRFIGKANTSGSYSKLSNRPLSTYSFFLMVLFQ